MAAVLPLSETLKRELPVMLDEHRQITAAAEELRAAAVKEGSGPALRFVEKLLMHARVEEEILYPAAIVVGDMVCRDPEKAPAGPCTQGADPPASPPAPRRRPRPA